MPTILRHPHEIHAAVDAWRGAGKRIGFVPTLGALHEGHRSLMRSLRPDVDILLVSIYVNPLQFGPNEDFAAYPRTEEADLAACEEEGVDAVLLLDKAEIKPDVFASFVDVEGVTGGFEGARRPGHFRGVATIVTILFHLARPHIVAFGQKDAQQVAVIERMTADLQFGIEIRVVPTLREPDGLAMSSRNRYLSPAERERALALSAGLTAATAAYRAGERGVAALEGIAREPLEAVNAEIEYVSLADRATFQAPDADRLADGDEVFLLIAARIGRTRLIDNTILPPT